MLHAAFFSGGAVCNAQCVRCEQDAALKLTVSLSVELLPVVGAVGGSGGSSPCFTPRGAVPG